MRSCGYDGCAKEDKTEFRGTRFCLEHLTHAVVTAASEPLPNVEGSSSDVYGLDRIPHGCKAFFLVNGQQNAIYAQNHEQRAVGIDIWRRCYTQFPAFAQVERFWVVLNDNEDSRAFLISIAAEKSIRKRCRISTLGVQWVAKQRMLRQRERRYSADFHPTEDEIFEKGLQFQNCPFPSQLYKLDQLGRPKRESNEPGRTN